MRSRGPLALLVLVLAFGCSQSEQIKPRTDNVWMYSEAKEIEIGASVAKEVEREFSMDTHPELGEYIDQVGQALVKVSDRPKIRYTFKVLDSPIPNAFAVPGGYIYITRGILGVIDDEAELAGIIGHEIGHVAARHSVKRLQNGTLAQIAMVALAIAGSNYVSGEMFSAINDAYTLIVLGYSRGDEYQADLLGAKYLYRSGYDPEGMVGAMEGLLELETRDPLQSEEYLRSHPFTSERIKHLQLWIPRLPREDHWGGAVPTVHIRGKETFERLAKPYAIYQGEAEMRVSLENLRLAYVRRQPDQALKSVDETYRDAKGRSREEYVRDLRAFCSSCSVINVKFTEIEAEPGRTAGVLRFRYVLQARETGTKRVIQENGKGTARFVKTIAGIWKITDLLFEPDAAGGVTTADTAPLPAIPAQPDPHSYRR